MLLDDQPLLLLRVQPGLPRVLQLYFFEIVQNEASQHVQEDHIQDEKEKAEEVFHEDVGAQLGDQAIATDAGGEAHDASPAVGCRHQEHHQQGGWEVRHVHFCLHPIAP